VKISQVIAALHFVVVSSCLENFLDDAILAVPIPHFDRDLQPYSFWLPIQEGHVLACFLSLLNQDKHR